MPARHTVAKPSQKFAYRKYVFEGGGVFFYPGKFGCVDFFGLRLPPLTWGPHPYLICGPLCIFYDHDPFAALNY
jgi:hypothetical protein